MEDKDLDLSRTASALEAYDKAYDKFMTLDLDSSEHDVMDELQYVESLAETVGHAYGLDTSDRNNLEDCRRYIRPGAKEPNAGEELSMVRKMVAEYLERIG